MSVRVPNRTKAVRKQVRKTRSKETRRVVVAGKLPAATLRALRRARMHPRHAHLDALMD